MDRHRVRADSRVSQLAQSRLNRRAYSLWLNYSRNSTHNVAARNFRAQVEKLESVRLLLPRNHRVHRSVLLLRDIL